MIDAKDIARKIAGGCGHHAVVQVPCAGCIENAMLAWETGIRDDMKRQLRDECAEAGKREQQAMRELEKARKACESAIARALQLDTECKVLRDTLRAANARVAELQTQLHAHQASRVQIGHA